MSDVFPFYRSLLTMWTRLNNVFATWLVLRLQLFFFDKFRFFLCFSAICGIVIAKAIISFGLSSFVFVCMCVCRIIYSVVCVCVCFVFLFLELHVYQTFMSELYQSNKMETGFEQDQTQFGLNVEYAFPYPIYIHPSIYPPIDLSIMRCHFVSATCSSISSIYLLEANK